MDRDHTWELYFLILVLLARGVFFTWLIQLLFPGFWQYSLLIFGLNWPRSSQVVATRYSNPWLWWPVVDKQGQTAQRFKMMSPMVEMSKTPKNHLVIWKVDLFCLFTFFFFFFFFYNIFPWNTSCLSSISNASYHPSQSPRRGSCYYGNILTRLGINNMRTLRILSALPLCWQVSPTSLLSPVFPLPLVLPSTCHLVCLPLPWTSHFSLYSQHATPARAWLWNVTQLPVTCSKMSHRPRRRVLIKRVYFLFKPSLCLRVCPLPYFSLLSFHLPPFYPPSIPLSISYSLIGHITMV